MPYCKNCLMACTGKTSVLQHPQLRRYTMKSHHGELRFSSACLPVAHSHIHWLLMKCINCDNFCSQRTCWWNEICKEEFQRLFRCKCPLWSYCRSPGRYYNAFCTMTGTGYIWTQPDRSWGVPIQQRADDRGSQ